MPFQDYLQDPVNRVTQVDAAADTSTGGLFTGLGKALESLGAAKKSSNSNADPNEVAQFSKKLQELKNARDQGTVDPRTFDVQRDNLVSQNVVANPQYAKLIYERNDTIAGKSLSTVYNEKRTEAAATFNTLGESMLNDFAKDQKNLPWYPLVLTPQVTQTLLRLTLKQLCKTFLLIKVVKSNCLTSSLRWI